MRLLPRCAVLFLCVVCVVPSLSACGRQPVDSSGGLSLTPGVPAAAAPSGSPAAPLSAAMAPIIADTTTPTASATPTPLPLPNLAIASMREREYPGSELVIEQTLTPGSNYDRYIASYLSDDLKINALFTVPRGDKPASGWPVVIFNHGYIPPQQYRTTERYVAYVNAFARNGYIVLKSDYRGHDQSEGRASGGYGSPDYTVDVLNAVASIKRYPDADPNRIGMWGHSMGGQITLRSMVVSQDIKAGVIWAGVVASYPDLFTQWHRRTEAAGVDAAADAAATPATYRRGWRGDFTARYGSPEVNPEFWAAISPNSFLTDLTGPVQLHHGTNDHSVPIIFSESLAAQIEAVGGQVELYTYEGDDHNLSQSLSQALGRSVEFFDRYVKGTPDVAP